MIVRLCQHKRQVLFTQPLARSQGTPRAAADASSRHLCPTIRLSRSGVRNRPPAIRNRSCAPSLACRNGTAPVARSVLSPRRYRPHSPADDRPYRKSPLILSLSKDAHPHHLPLLLSLSKEGGGISALPQAGGPRDLGHEVALVAAGWAPERRARVTSRKAAKPRRGCARRRRPPAQQASVHPHRSTKPQPLRGFAALREYQKTQHPRASGHQGVLTEPLSPHGNNKKGSGSRRSLLSSAGLGRVLSSDPSRRWRSFRCRRSRTS